MRAQVVPVIGTLAAAAGVLAGTDIDDIDDIALTVSFVASASGAGRGLDRSSPAGTSASSPSW
ncbi:hypothetical protein RAJCM14343_1207 [Rhodococcus aetherivorans]|uniref:Uncharacterized protein n=1 Tax=Rhodococcus aetherivorans TaxID=191292 RepID=A0ABQ0YHD6_9NOCA|nr:hypothetical protein N505_0128430 [Rhodococcus aetherivorans]GES35958.1 hypothetical protein RAJCM14343_1207 [Rhodococcus aetherivorans]